MKISKAQLELLKLIGAQDGSSQMRIPRVDVMWPLQRERLATFSSCGNSYFFARITAAGQEILDVSLTAKPIP